MRERNAKHKQVRKTSDRKKIIANFIDEEKTSHRIEFTTLLSYRVWKTVSHWIHHAGDYFFFLFHIAFNVCTVYHNNESSFQYTREPVLTNQLSFNVQES